MEMGQAWQEMPEVKPIVVGYEHIEERLAKLEARVTRLEEPDVEYDHLASRMCAVEKTLKGEGLDGEPEAAREL